MTSTIEVITPNQRRIIELSNTTKDADKFVEQFTPYLDIRDKLEFVKHTFQIAFLGRCDDPDLTAEAILATDYEAALNAIINKKWR